MAAAASMFTLRFGVTGTVGEQLHQLVRFAGYSNAYKLRTALLSTKTKDKLMKVMP